MELPGQSLEKAAGEVATDAGKTLIGAFRRMLDAWSALRSARNRAEADEIEKDIHHKGDMKRQSELEEERRRQDVLEIEHLRKLNELTGRGMQRTINQITDEQGRVEWIANRSIMIANGDPEGSDSREIPDDWLKRFFKYAADVDEEKILEILARGLADAAIRNRPILSPKALDALRFFELDSFKMFEFCAREASYFDALPAEMLENRASLLNFDLDIVLMTEMGLVKEERQKYASFHLGNVDVVFSYDSGVGSDFRVFKLTYVGKSIGSLLDRRAGRLQAAIRKRAVSPEIAELQSQLGLTPDIVRTLARLLMSQLADTREIDIRAYVLKDASRHELFSRRRKSPLDELGISRSDFDVVQDNFTRDLINEFVDVFVDFDKNQLPYLYTDDKREALGKSTR